MGGGAVPHPVLAGGYPIPGLGGGYPIQSWPGRYPIQSLLRGVPQGTPHPDLGWGTPLCQLDKVPLPSRPRMGMPPPVSWMGYPPPPPGPGMGYLPPPMVNRQTFQSINITFPRTTYAGGKDKPIPSVLLFLMQLSFVPCDVILKSRSSTNRNVLDVSMFSCHRLVSIYQSPISQLRFLMHDLSIKRNFRENKVLLATTLSSDLSKNHPGF